MGTPRTLWFYLLFLWHGPLPSILAYRAITDLLNDAGPLLTRMSQTQENGAQGTWPLGTWGKRLKSLQEWKLWKFCFFKEGVRLCWCIWILGKFKYTKYSTCLLSFYGSELFVELGGGVSTKNGPWAKSTLLSVFVNKVLLQHSHAIGWWTSTAVSAL